jgi:hypothetical protein
MIYPTAVGGEVWHLPANPKNDLRFNAANLTGNPTDGFTIADDTKVMSAETSGGYNFGSTVQMIDHSFIDSVGYMYASTDWRDVEITGYFNCQNVPENLDARIQMFARGAERSDNRPWCPGSFYCGELTMDGRFRWTKGQYHISYTNKEWIESNNVGLGTNLRELGWFGFKIVMYNVDIGTPGEGLQGVKLEAYVDDVDNNEWDFIQTSDVTDNGGWGEDGEICGGHADQIITWGGPLVSFKFENGADIRFRKLSAREIAPSAVFADPTASIPENIGSFPAANRVVATTRHLYRMGTFIAPTCIGEIPTDPDPPAPPPGGGLTTSTKRIAHRSKINRSSRLLLRLLLQLQVRAGLTE